MADSVKCPIGSRLGLSSGFGRVIASFGAFRSVVDYGRLRLRSVSCVCRRLARSICSLGRHEDCGIVVLCCSERRLICGVTGHDGLAHATSCRPGIRRIVACVK